MTIEDILREKGQLVKRGTLGTDGDLEFWDDGSMTVREKGEEGGKTKEGKGKTQEEGEGWSGSAPGASFGKKVGGETGL